MSENLKDNNQAIAPEAEIAADMDVTAEDVVAEFTDAEAEAYVEGELTKGEKAKFMFLSPLVNSIIKFSLIGIGLVAAILWLVATLVPSFSTAMADGFYKGFTAFTGAIFGFIPVSMMEIVVILTLVGWLAYLTFVIVRAIQFKKSKLLVGRLWIQFGYATLAIVMVFTTFFSFGYGIASGRTSFVKSYTIDGQQVYSNARSTVAQLGETNLYLIDKLNRLVLNTDGKGVINYGANTGLSRYAAKGNSTLVLAQKVADAFDAAAKDIPALQGPSVKTKELLFGPLYTYMEVGSIYSPVTGEILVNSYYPEVAVPMLVAKAIAKERGFQSEEQANFIAFLVCTQYSQEAYIQYSGYFDAYIKAGDKLYQVEKVDHALLAASLKECVKKEIVNYTRKIDKLYGNSSTISFTETGMYSANENYLDYPRMLLKFYKENSPYYSNGEENGISFGAYVNLLINFYQKDAAWQSDVQTTWANYTTSSTPTTPSGEGAIG